MRPDLSCLCMCNFIATVEFCAYYSLLMHDVCTELQFNGKLSAYVLII